MVAFFSGEVVAGGTEAALEDFGEPFDLDFVVGWGMIAFSVARRVMVDSSGHFLRQIDPLRVSDV